MDRCKRPRISTRIAWSLRLTRFATGDIAAVGQAVITSGPNSGYTSLFITGDLCSLENRNFRYFLCLTELER